MHFRPVEPGKTQEKVAIPSGPAARVSFLLRGWGMFNAHQLLHNSSPTVDAYDGAWLELLENPEAAPPARDASGSPESSPLDGGSGTWGAFRGPGG
jgi:hypothetical protein